MIAVLFKITIPLHKKLAILIVLKKLIATIKLTQAYLEYNKVFAGLVQYEFTYLMKLFSKFTKSRIIIILQAHIFI